MEEDKIRKAFTKAKQDILFLQSEISSIKQEIQELKTLIIQNIRQIQQTNRQTDTPTHLQQQTTRNQSQDSAHSPTQKPQISTNQHINPTETQTPTHFPTDNLPLKALKSQNLEFSTGNEGVPTDRQTNQQTDNSTRNKGVKVRLTNNPTQNPTHSPTQNTPFPVLQENPQSEKEEKETPPINKETQIKQDKITKLEQVADFISSLDDIKKSLRRQLKNLTKQEMLVFTTIYQLEEEGFVVDYPTISKKLSLTESSIRDYTQRLIKKALPLEKTKENNKKIILSISQNLRKIASLANLIQLREL